MLKKTTKQRWIPALLAGLCLLSVARAEPTSETHRANQPPAPVIVIKADDLVYRPKENVLGAGWNRFLPLVVKQDIPVGIGIIGDSLDQDVPEYFARIDALHATGRFEFWNHGYTHARDRDTGESEFKGPDWQTQRATLLRTQRLAKERLGFELHVFGAPFNAVDTATVEAMRAVPELTCWLYGPAHAKMPPGEVVLRHTIDIEQPVHHPNLAAFKRDFERDRQAPYHVLQIHPGGWDEDRLAEYGEIITYLKDQGVEFMTPSQLCSRLLREQDVPSSGK